MPLPFEFEPRPIDALYGNERAIAHRAGICVDCGLPVDYDNLSELDQREYRISYICPACFDALTGGQD